MGLLVPVHAEPDRPATPPKHVRTETFRSSFWSTTGQTIRCHIQRSVQGRGDQDPSHALAGAASQCLCRTIRSVLGTELTRQPLHPQRMPPAVSAGDPHRSLQPGETAPRSRLLPPKGSPIVAAVTPLQTVSYIRLGVLIRALPSSCFLAPFPYSVLSLEGQACGIDMPLEPSLSQEPWSSPVQSATNSLQ